MTPTAAPSTATEPTTPPRPAGRELGHGVALLPGADIPLARGVLVPGAVALLARLHRELAAERAQLLEAREARQAAFDAGAVPEYLDAESEAVRGDWRVAPVPQDLSRRRVEITGPVNDTKMVINMLSRNPEGDRADAAMVDFEDSMKPSWKNVLDGVVNVAGAARRDLTFVKSAAGRPDKVYALDPEDMAKLMVRVRGLHLAETNVTIDGEPVAAGLFDFALCLFHAARPQVERGETPAFYVPKCEHHLEARWWNRLFTLAQEAVGLTAGTLRATFLIETLPAAFQMEEILHEIRHHAAGLNVGRWDKIFSDIKVLRNHPDRVMADRASIHLGRPWMRDYALRLVEICHRRGAYAIGGMAAFTPGRTPDLRRHQTSKVLADKQLEASMGHDGCWVSHPYFIGPALSAFPHDHQLGVRHPEADRPDLLPRATPPLTLDGLRTNVRVGIGYLDGWRRDVGCVAWDGLMEDLATLEISRAQTWQWLRHRVELEDGQRVTVELIRRLFAEELDRIHLEVAEALEGASEDAVAARRDAFTAAAEEAQAIFLEEGLRPFLSLASDAADAELS
ncbi:MAG: malate synthase A [Acidobacteriota bacterium]